MTAVENEKREYTVFSPPYADYQNVKSNSYRCVVVLEKEDDGGYSASVLNLPGAASCGDTIEETMKNIREAIIGVLEEYAASGSKIPWKEESLDSVPSGSIVKRIYVNV